MTIRRLITLAAILSGCVGWAPAEAQTETARYEVTVKVEWSEQSHPLEYPTGAHWSGLLAVAHNERFTLFADGQTATSGLALL